jgi:hypothetical protein
VFVAMPVLADLVAGREREIADAVGIPLDALLWLCEGSARATPELQQQLAALLDVDAAALFVPSPTLARLLGDRRADPDGDVARRVRAACRP